MMSSDQRAPLWFGVATVVVCLGFAVFTAHIWEDYFITFRASLNLATGNGLVYQPGERVHSFTSPLGTLLPAFFAMGGVESVAVRALWGLRIVSAVALGGALWMAIRTFQRDGLANLAVVSAGMAWVLDPKIVDFAMNGMETGLLVFFVTFMWHAFATGAPVWLCALGFAGLQWTRPDGFVYFAALAIGWMLFGAKVAGIPWRQRITLLIRVGAYGGVLYLPWFLFAWSYYGSPVPHTILAKAQPHTVGEIAGLWASYPWELLFGHCALHDVFKPAYYFLGGWPEFLNWTSRILATCAAAGWAWPRVAPAGRMAAAAFFVGGFYVSYIPPFPWYYPGWQALGWIACAYLLHALWQLRPRPAWAAVLPSSVTRIVAALIVTLQAGLFICVAWQMRTQQTLIENGHRREVGRWLARQAATGDTVYLECLGYIGYYSGLKMLDFPGLCAPEVVAARRAGHRSFAQVIEALQPKWVVIRPFDQTQLRTDTPAFAKTYTFERLFDTRNAIDTIPLLPGRGYLAFDSVFLVYRRSASLESRP
jgi:hypothetical protein